MKKIKIILIFIIFAISSCTNGEIKSGEIKAIPFSGNLAVGTDSTIVIIDRRDGTTLNTIYRHQQ
jgi:hypothetical protein